MTDKEIQEGNKLIAEFMGGELNVLDNGFGDTIEAFWFLPGNNPNPHCSAATYKRPQELEYHSRWDWLMPVVQKIKQLEMDWPLATDRVLTMAIWSGIVDVWLAIVEFINSFNQNK